MKKPTIDALHKDLEFANNYRLEFIKIFLATAAALFAFSVTFLPQVQTPIWQWMFWVAWIGLAVSLFGGFAQLASWERFYSSYQRYEHKDRDGASHRSRVTQLRRIALAAQVMGFIVGVIALGAFTSGNLSSSKPMLSSNQAVK